MKIVVALAFLVGCGGGGGGGGGGDDAPLTDGPATSDDGPPSDGPAVTSPLGTTCTPDANNPQGSCPVGFDCLNLQGATNPWCSKTCQTGAGDTCATGYPGPGKAACILMVGPEGGPAENFCAVICEDTTQEMQFCPECNGTCPGAMMCTQPIANTGQGGGTLGNACK
jgi:hypothetical protein